MVWQTTATAYSQGSDRSRKPGERIEWPSIPPEPIRLKAMPERKAVSVESTLLGSTEPRLWTRPLRELTPETSYGFNVIEFAKDVLKEPLDDWQAWAAVHAGELLPDGRPRFRTILICVARQNGKTHLLKVLSLFWLYAEKCPLVTGMSTNLDTAREAWTKAVDDAESNLTLRRLTQTIRRANGQETLITKDKARYRIAASNRTGGRGFTIHRLVLDELREHRSWEAWNASVPATNAVPDAQIFAISNAGDDGSEVLNSLRESALSGTDGRLGILEWSAPEGVDVLDPAGWVAANPNLGRRLDESAISGPAARAKASGGQEEASFKTEMLCQRVRSLDAGVDPAAWHRAGVDGDLLAVRSRIALALDMSPDGLHATLCAAAVVRPGVVRVEAVAAWGGIGCSGALRADLPAWLERVKARSLGWYPGGPAAALMADLGKTAVMPRGVEVTEIRGDMAAVCMGFAEQLSVGAIEHPIGDQLLDAHILGAEKLRRGDTWVFSRKGGHCDAAYAAAAAVHVARVMPPRPSFTRPSSIP